MKSLIRNIPTKPGIYLFFDKNKKLVYVGKATSLKSRVRSYFAGQKSPRPIESLIDEVKNIKWIVTDSVLEAIILEANYIKKYQPKCNILGKDDKSWNYLAITKREFPTLKAIRQHDLKQLSLAEQKKKFLNVFGPFPGLNTQAILKLLRKLFAYSSCSPTQARACFYYQLEQCLGVCTNEITSKEYSKKVVRPLTLFFKGNKKQLIKDLEKQMKSVSKDENYEEAQRLRDQISDLKKIHDVALLNKNFYTDIVTLRFTQHPNAVSGAEPKCDNIKRIEGYDISNLNTTDKVGSMVVFINGEAETSEYRKFKIQTVIGQSDVDCLKEILTRRLKHAEWSLPQLFLIDGGKPQVNAVKEILTLNKIEIPVIGIAKGPSRKKNEFLAPKILAKWLTQNKNLLIQVRDEAHRFAIKYNRELRKIKVTNKSFL
ncbi:MAG: Excinuclease ABC subunit C [Parcubacteria group bacterium GW2011_GWC2_39_14]|nr:MAG: Excinuclease ABC subunit C [Parcubacteria group bacterium GW2011_GWC2_39_14]KKR54985.1 MAG: Excinuclease ABC subunit C [Parcubacteria group bacterium GW2011_GWA2_40_23]